MVKYGEFGRNANVYAKTRRGYPPEILRLLKRVSVKRPLRVLDLGCGTGISTRFVASKAAVVVGLDRDRRMLAQAIEMQPQNALFIFGHAEALPFVGRSFDVVTAFGALHWFRLSSALAEIERVLVADGMLLIVNKHDTSDLKVEFRRQISGLLGTNLPDTKSHYDPEAALKVAGYRSVRKLCFIEEEAFSPAEAMEYFRTTGIWSLIPHKLRDRAERIAEEIVAAHTNNNRFVRPIRVEAVIGLASHRISH